MIKPKVFLDTNVWFSAFYGSTGCSQIIKKHIESDILAIISEDVLNELVKNIIKKIPQAKTALEKLLKAKPPEIIKSPTEINKTVKRYVDLKDCHIFQAAINSKSEYFVTGNLKDFNTPKLESIYKIKILSPAQFLKNLNFNHNG